MAEATKTEHTMGPRGRAAGETIHVGAPRDRQPFRRRRESRTRLESYAKPHPFNHS